MGTNICTTLNAARWDCIPGVPERVAIDAARVVQDYARDWSGREDLLSPREIQRAMIHYMRVNDWLQGDVAGYPRPHESLGRSVWQSELRDWIKRLMAHVRYELNITPGITADMNDAKYLVCEYLSGWPMHPKHQDGKRDTVCKAAVDIVAALVVAPVMD